MLISFYDKCDSRPFHDNRLNYGLERIMYYTLCADIYNFFPYFQTIVRSRNIECLSIVALYYRPTFHIFSYYY